MNKISFGCFPKFLVSLDQDELMDRLASCGLDSVNAVVRDGYWTPEEQLSSSIFPFTESARKAGLNCDFATWAESPEVMLEKEDQMKALADAGLRGFRTGYFTHTPRVHYIDAIAKSREVLKRLAEKTSSLGLRVVVQVHHGRLVTSPESAAFLVEGLAPEQVGLMLDAGNQGYEGGLAWERAEAILGQSWTDLGVKDTRYDNGKRNFVPCDEGEQSWDSITKAWLERKRLGRWVLQPFYGQGNVETHIEILKREVSFLRKAVALAHDT